MMGTKQVPSSVQIFKRLSVSHDATSFGTVTQAVGVAKFMRDLGRHSARKHRVGLISVLRFTIFWAALEPTNLFWLSTK